VPRYRRRDSFAVIIGAQIPTRESMRRAALGLPLALLLAAGHVLAQVTETVRIAMPDPGVAMVGGVFRPSGEGPFPVVVYSHGRSGTEVERARTRPPVMQSHVRYWLDKGFAVVAPIRPGYGQTGGADREDSGVRYDIFGNCWGPPGFGRAAAAAREAVLATLAWIRQQPWADASRIVLEGTSMGGLASIATAAVNPPGVVAYVNFAGGTGGDGSRAPGHSCGSADMRSLMSIYGAMTRVPGLWLYARNDSYWGTHWPRAWHRAFAEAGGPASFVMTDPVPGADGHALLARGAPQWRPHVDRFIAWLDAQDRWPEP
jgi:dienelactone hydrolase